MSKTFEFASILSADTDHSIAVILFSFKYSITLTGNKKSFVSIKYKVAPVFVNRQISLSDASKKSGV